ncbi:response regulator [Psychrobacillus sp. NPDC058041]|uniref:response regulator n=1 Tax=Psychrobacillus sp. NPDC058041 TaxID=3346310 RepID=UPI0036D785AC
MIQKGSSWILIFCTIGILFYMIFSDSETRKTNQFAVDGLINLSRIPASEQISALTGEWKFIPNKLLAPDDFPKEASNIQVPGPWQSNDSYGTYQLEVKVPPHFHEIGIRIRNIWSAHQLFINNEKVASKGKVGTTKETTDPNNPTYEVYIKPPADTFTLTIQVADFYNARHGIIFPIDIGEANAIKNDVIRDTTLEWIAVFILFIFAIFHFSLFLLRTKERAFFFSGMYFFTLSFLILTRGERLLLREFPSLSFEWYFRFQDFITYINSVMLIFFLIYTIKSIMKKSTAIFLTTPLTVYGIATLVFPARSLSSWQSFFFAYINLLAIFIIVRFVYLFVTKKAHIPKNELIVLGMSFIALLIFAGSGAIDQLFFSGRNLLNQVGIILFILCMNVFIAMRLINRTTDAEIFSEKLEKATIGKDSFLEVTTNELVKPIYHSLNITKELAIANPSAEHQILEQQLERLLFLVSELQDFTRIRFQDFQIDVHPVHLQMVAQHVITMNQKKMEKLNIQLFIQVEPTLQIKADEQRLSQIIYRIIETTMAHAENGRIMISAIHCDTEVLFTIEGTGTKTIHQIAANETEQSIGKAIIEQMGGTYKVDILQTGIRFALTLPFYNYVEQQSSYPESLVIAATSQTNEALPKLLIVEDDVIHAEVLKSLLSADYNIRLAHTGIQALTSIQEQRPDYLLVDEVMPGMDGIELTKKIRETDSYIDLPIIMLVTNEYPTNVAIVLEAGANDYIRKPATKETLIARLSAIALTKQAVNKAVEHEMAFLQAQIKPHFLYNAISSIISFCYTDGERAAHLLTMLSTYLRYIFDSGKEGHHATLEKELEIIRAYVEIEQARFGDRLAVVFEIDETLNTTQIGLPSLLIQPLVENAIRHGIFEKEGQGCVTIRIHLENKRMRIDIIDNGIGMTEIQVEKLLQGKQSLQQGIGFSNVLRRVHEIPNARLTISSLPNKGTKMTLSLPVKENNYVENNYR